MMNAGLPCSASMLRKAAVRIARLAISGAPVVPRVQPAPPSDQLRVSGHVEATEVQIGAEVGGRILELPVAEGDRPGAELKLQ